MNVTTNTGPIQSKHAIISVNTEGGIQQRRNAYVVTKSVTVQGGLEPKEGLHRFNPTGMYGLRFTGLM
jgi:hypothetical protein